MSNKLIKLVEEKKKINIHYLKIFVDLLIARSYSPSLLFHNLNLTLDLTPFNKDNRINVKSITLGYQSFAFL